MLSIVDFHCFRIAFRGNLFSLINLRCYIILGCKGSLGGAPFLVQ